MFLETGAGQEHDTSEGLFIFYLQKCRFLALRSNDLFQAQKRLKGTVSSQKNELLDQEFGINYNNEPAIFRKGTTLVRDEGGSILELADDIIGEEFWNERPHLLPPSWGFEISRVY